MSSPIEDTLWQRAFWRIAQEEKEAGRQSVIFDDVDSLVLEWSKMPLNQLFQMLAGDHCDGE